MEKRRDGLLAPYAVAVEINNKHALEFVEDLGDVLKLAPSAVVATD